MSDKLCVSERRMKLLTILNYRKQSTCSELPLEFNVSVKTINRDVDFLSNFVPIYTKRGKGGGVYILPEYRSYKSYLSKEHEECLYELMDVANKKQRRILNEIIIQFTHNANIAR